MTFRFRLDPVLGHRERCEDERKRELSVAQRALLEAENAREVLVRARESGRDRLRRQHTGLDVDQLRASYAHLAYLDRVIDVAEGQVAIAMQHVEHARAALLVATKEKKVLEALKTRRRAAFDLETALAAQRELDDQNARAFGRAQRLGGTSP
jgi:flagellar export protein FliJ